MAFDLHQRRSKSRILVEAPKDGGSSDIERIAAVFSEYRQSTDVSNCAYGAIVRLMMSRSPKVNGNTG
jgi:hypothetical protein